MKNLNLRGWRTILIGLVFATAPSALDYLAGVDWTHLVGPNFALTISGAVMIGMRLITTTAPGEKS